MFQLSKVLSSTRGLLAVFLAALISLTSFAAPAPAKADTAGQISTRNIILGGLAAAVAVILYNNYHHRQVAANTVVGYTRDGGTVYGDGRVVYPDGTVLYTGNRPGARCTYDGYGAPCNPGAYAYNYGPNYQPGYNNGPYYGPAYRPRSDNEEEENENGDGYNGYRQANYAPYYGPARGYYARANGHHRKLRHRKRDRDDRGDRGDG
jgi:hypothetical protein